MKFDRIATSQTDVSCSLEIYTFSLAKALVFLWTFWHRASTCLSNFSLLSISTPRSLTCSFAQQENPNHFTIWCQWAGMIVRVDKGCTFDIKKISLKSSQIQPKLFINKEIVPCVKHDDSFRYIGRHFNFYMSNQVHKAELSNLVTSTLNIIDSLPLHPKNKVLLYNSYLLSKISWRFTICDLSKTWIVQNLDNTVSHYICKWLDLPIFSTLSNILLPREKFGLDIILPSTFHY